MSSLHFEDLHEFKGNGDSYAITNEGLAEWAELFEGLEVSRAAGICSSGEVGLLTILPHVKDELVLIDHSYDSLRWAMLKYLLLQEVGADETHRLLRGVDVRSCFTRFEDRLPEKIAKSPRGYAKSSDISYYWPRVGIDLVRNAVPKLDCVKFLHGDLSDLPGRGQFDLIYVSNAHTHSDRNGRRFSVSSLISALNPGGYIAIAEFNDPYPPRDTAPPRSMKEVASRRGCGTIRWTQSLWQLEGETVGTV